VLPAYVHGPIGAGDVAVGVVIGAFAVSAVVCRPLAGRAADARGRRAVVVAGSACMALAGLVYFVHAGVPGLLVARLLTGAGEAAVFTAGATWAIDLAPAHRRAQVIGFFGLAVWGGLTVGPLVGTALHSSAGYAAVWSFAAVTPVLAALVARSLREPRAPRAAGPRRALLPARAIRPGIALALANVGYAAMAGFVVLHLSHRGIGHGASAFTAFAASVVGTRLLAGRLPDRFGAVPTALGAFVAETCGLVVLAAAPSLAVALVGAVAMGAGFSVLFPSLALLVVGEADDDARGSAMGAFTAFFDAGVGLGGPLAGAISALAGYPSAFWAAAVCAALGAAVVLTRRDIAPGPASGRAVA
jgi:MFS family permease